MPIALFSLTSQLAKPANLPDILLVGCWYHACMPFLEDTKTRAPPMSVTWLFDRVGRLGRVALVGARRAKVTELGERCVRIDVPGIGIRLGSEPSKHVYAYSPRLNLLRPWENHPFSILLTALLAT